MEVVQNLNNQELELKLIGRLDTNTYPILENIILENKDKINSLIINMEKLDYISSAGLRIILSAHRVMSKKGGMKIINANDNIREVFDITGFITILNFE